MKIRQGAAITAMAATAVGLMSGCSSSGNAGGVPQVQCFASATSSDGYTPFTIQVLGASDCTAITSGVNDGSLSTVGGYTAKANTGSASGTEICSGVIGNYPVNVYATKPDTGICLYMGVPAVP